MKRIYANFLFTFFLIQTNLLGDPGGGGEFLIRIINSVSGKINFYIPAKISTTG